MRRVTAAHSPRDVTPRPLFCIIKFYLYLIHIIELIIMDFFLFLFASQPAVVSRYSAQTAFGANCWLANTKGIATGSYTDCIPRHHNHFIARQIYRDANSIRYIIMTALLHALFRIVLFLIFTFVLLNNPLFLNITSIGWHLVVISSSKAK